MMERALAAVGLALLLGGCTLYRDALPLAAYPNVVSTATTIRAHVDGNGDFYPEDWRRGIGKDALRRTHSLRLALGCPNGPRCAELEVTRKGVLEDFREAVKGKERVFFLVHGFNDEQGGASDSYELVKDNIVFRPEDAVVEFYWDGDKGSFVGIGRVWFFAVGNSQMAGIHGLRSLMNEVHDSEVILISHSRGASVILSALSNPAFSERFEERTAGIASMTPPALEPNGNKIRALMMAPAIGNPDFWAPGSRKGPEKCALRAFPANVDAILYTVNPKDPTLAKWHVPFLSGNFNATDLGLKAFVGDRLRVDEYPMLEPYPLELKTHNFKRYARHDALRQMLRDSRVKLRGAAPPSLSPPPPDPMWLEEKKPWVCDPPKASSAP